MLRFFLDRECAHRTVKFHHTVALGIAHLIGENRGTFRAAVGRFEQLLKMRAVKEVVAQNQRRGVIADKVASENKGLCKAVRAGLHAVRETDAPLRTVAQQVLKARQIHRCGDKQNVTDPCRHQGGEGIVDHRLVINGQELFAHRKCDRCQACARAAGQNQTFSSHSVMPYCCH